VKDKEVNIEGHRKKELVEYLLFWNTELRFPWSKKGVVKGTPLIPSKTRSEIQCYDQRHEKPCLSLGTMHMLIVVFLSIIIIPSWIAKNWKFSCMISAKSRLFVR